MKNRRSVIFGIVMLVVAVLLIVVRDRTSPPAPAAAEHKSPPASSDSPAAARSARDVGSASSDGEAVPERRRTTQPGAAGKVEKAMDQLLADDHVSQRDATIGLVEIACNRKVAADQRVDALQHALNLTPDRDHKELIRAWLENGSFESELLQRTLLDDAFNRDEIVKLPTAYALLNSEHEAIAKDAAELLGFVLEVTPDEREKGNVPWKKRIDDYMQARNLQP